jgi:lipopolysaccharide transport system ATP-binding protein
VIKPETLIIDEMLGAGDAYFLGKSNERMLALVDGGASVLLVSHSTDQILRFCDEAIWLDRGRVVERGPSLEVVRSYEQFTRNIEERRLQARNRRLRAGIAPAREQDEYEALVLRLAVSGEQASLDVRELSVLEEGESLETLLVGGPQDGDTSHTAFVTLEGSDWSEPQAMNGHHWRSLVARPGHPGASGSATLGLFSPAPNRRYEALLKYRSAGASGATLAIWRGAEFMAEAELPVAPRSEWQEQRIPIEASMHVGAGTAVRHPAELHQARSERRVSHWPGERSIMIDDALTQGADGRERSIFEPGEELSLRIRVKAHRPGPFTVIPVAVLYRLDGIRVSPHIGDRAELDLAVGETTDIRLVLAPLNLGDGRYIFSVSLYRKLSAAAPEIYDLVDRSYEFEVRQNDTLRDGIFQHPSRWEIG